MVGREGRRGSGDSAIGAKVNLIESPDGWKPEVGLLGGLSLPTGGEEFSSDGVDPSFRLTFLLSEAVQIDVFVGSGLRGPTDDLFVGTGLSFRLSR